MVLTHNSVDNESGLVKPGQAAEFLEPGGVSTPETLIPVRRLRSEHLRSRLRVISRFESEFRVLDQSWMVGIAAFVVPASMRSRK